MAEPFPFMGQILLVPYSFAPMRASAVVDGDAFGKFEGIEEGD